MSSEAATAVVQPTPKAASPVLREPSLTPTLEADDTPAFPVSMVVHGGTGILHGNMTSLTVNQYIGVVPDRGAWDSGRVRELMADAVKVSAEANSQLFHPSTSDSSSRLTSGLSNKERKKKLWIILLGTIMVCAVSLGTLAMKTKSLPVEIFHPTTSSTLEMVHVNDTIANNVTAPQILQRMLWLGQPASGVLEEQTLPVTTLIVSDTGSEPCLQLTECIASLRNQQRYDMQSLKYQDIAFNFLIGGDGNIYVGRGWNFLAADRNIFHSGSVGVAFVGSFNDTLPNEGQMEAFNELVAVGVASDKIAANYTLVNLCQLSTERYYDLALATNMTSWPHFDNTLPISRCA